jgi:hypothetical protein
MCRTRFIASIVVLSTHATHINSGPITFNSDWIYIMFLVIAIVDVASSLVLYFGIVSEPMILSWFIGQCSCIVGLFIIFVAVASAQMVNHIWVILLLLGFKTYFVIVIFSYYRSIFNQGMVIN